MAYGIKVFSANGAVQLDSTDTNQILYQEFASGTSSAITGAGTGMSLKKLLPCPLLQGMDLLYMLQTALLFNITQTYCQQELKAG